MQWPCSSVPFKLLAFSASAAAVSASGHLLAGTALQDVTELQCVARTGDVIGALWNRMSGQITFFKNGVSLGVAFENVRSEKLYPTVGLRTTGEQV